MTKKLSQSASAAGISMSWITLVWSMAFAVCAITVAGLPMDHPDKIFTHFCSTRPTGMGMGLTIARSIVEADGGELGAENADQGARFFFRLPAAEKSERREVA